MAIDVLDIGEREVQPTDPRAAWLAQLAGAAEALAADLAENPEGREVSRGWAALVGRAQALAEDMLNQAAGDGVLTRSEAAAILRRARMDGDVGAGASPPASSIPVESAVPPVATRATGSGAKRREPPPPR